MTVLANERRLGEEKYDASPKLSIPTEIFFSSTNLQIPSSTSLLTLLGSQSPYLNMSETLVGINGFGRIGRIVFRNA